MIFETIFFDQIIDRTLFYSPKIEIKPAHLANGLFRAVCGKYADFQDQHEAIYPRAYPDPQNLPSYLRDTQNRRIREMLYGLLAADATVYSKPRFSSYTLSHVTHITSDNHDRRAGEWLLAILSHGAQPSPALAMLRELLMENDRQRSDELSTLTLPLAPPNLEALKPFTPTMRTTPSSLRIDENGAFADPVIRAIRAGFDQLAAYDIATARYGGKLDILRRLVIWSCFGVYLHLANTGREQLDTRVPILFCMPGERLPTLQQASIQSYRWVGRSLDIFFRKEIQLQVEQLRSSRQYGSWESDADIKRIIESIQSWKATSGRMRQTTRTDEDNVRDFRSFYYSYRSATASQPPHLAFANAAADLLDRVLSSSPEDIARNLGRRIGLLGVTNRRTHRRYTPQPDLLEVLVRASIPKGELWTINKLADHWSTQYGILFGALGNENEQLAVWGISAVDGSELRANADRVALLLEWSGYARRYADGVVLVTVKE
jgi:hypothetical protein